MEKGVRVSWWFISLLHPLHVSFLLFSVFTIAVSLSNEGENLAKKKKNPLLKTLTLCHV